LTYQLSRSHDQGDPLFFFLDVSSRFQYYLWLEYMEGVENTLHCSSYKMFEKKIDTEEGRGLILYVDNKLEAADYCVHCTIQTYRNHQ
jgi:hypothetical protein